MYESFQSNWGWEERSLSSEYLQNGVFEQASDFTVNVVYYLQSQGQMASTSATHEQEVESLQAQWRTEVASLNKDLKQAEKK